MKKNIFIILFILFTVTFCYSQDVITKKSGKNIKAKVLEVGQTEIKYKKFDNKNGPTYIISNSDVSMILYENGTKDMFNEEKKPGDVSFLNLTEEELFVKGQTDAIKYYDGYKPAATGTLIVGLLSPLAGLIPAIACSSTKPKDLNLNYPNEVLIKKPIYHKSYTTKAKKIKQGKVWSNWGMAFGANLVLAAILALN